MKSFLLAFFAKNTNALCIGADNGVEHRTVEEWNQQMFIAAQRGDLDGVRAAVEHGADPHAKDHNDENSMMLAAKNGIGYQNGKTLVKVCIFY